MREFLETIEDQLRRLAAEGNDSVPLDDESVAILRRMASSVSVSSAKAGRSPGVLRSDAEKISWTMWRKSNFYLIRTYLNL